MTKKNQKPYIVYVKGESESDWRGADPESITPLLESQGEKNTAGLHFKIITSQVELLLQKGDTAAAWDILDAYKQKINDKYQAPLNVFPKDTHNGNYPYIGAHCFFGAFRDAAHSIYPDCFYRKKGDGMPSKTHLRKDIQIRPHHVFLHRKDGVITEPNGIEGQQPVGDVKGFCRYEIIEHPFTFEWKMLVLTNSKFTKFLSDQDRVVEAIKKSSFHGIGGGRGVGYGYWRVTDIQIDPS